MWSNLENVTNKFTLRIIILPREKTKDIEPVVEFLLLFILRLLLLLILVVFVSNSKNGNINNLGTIYKDISSC